MFYHRWSFQTANSTVVLPLTSLFSHADSKKYRPKTNGLVAISGVVLCNLVAPTAGTKTFTGDYNYSNVQIVDRSFQTMSLMSMRLAGVSTRSVPVFSLQIKSKAAGLRSHTWLKVGQIVKATDVTVDYNSYNGRAFCDLWVGDYPMGGPSLEVFDWERAPPDLQDLANWSWELLVSDNLVPQENRLRDAPQVLKNKGTGIDIVVEVVGFPRSRVFKVRDSSETREVELTVQSPRGEMETDSADAVLSNLRIGCWILLKRLSSQRNGDLFVRPRDITEVPVWCKDVQGILAARPD